MRYFITDGKNWLNEFHVDLGHPITYDRFSMATSYPTLEIARTACKNVNGRSSEVYRIVDEKGTTIK